MRGKKTVRCIGGGPGGLFASLLLKKEYPEWDVVVYERNRADDTFGFGVVFSDETLGNLEDADPDSFREICESFAHWDEIDVFHKGRCIRSGGHGFSGLERMRLLQEILQARCRSVGVELHFESEVTPESLPPADLVLVCDGVNSRFRAAREDVLAPIWTGAPTDLFGWGAVGRLMHLHSISEKTQPDSGGSMRISTRKARAPSLWKRLKKRGKDQDWKEVRRRIRSATVRTCSPRNWRVILSTEIVPCGDSSPTVRNQRWTAGNWVLLGDAAHTAHFSIGSGTKLAMEDGIALRDALRESDSVEDGLHRYEEGRKPVVASLQRAAQVSLEWFEETERYFHDAEPEEFTFGLLTRSLRITHENLRKRDPEYVEAMDRWFATEKCGLDVSSGETLHRHCLPLFRFGV